MQQAMLIERPSARAAAIPVPEPGLTPEMLVARARALRPVLREAQEENEARGTYSDALHQTFREAGFYRITQPRLFGGYEFDLPTYYRTMIEIARGDPGTGWCLTLAASHGFVLASHWPEAAQREIFGPEGEFAAPHRAQPMGKAKPVDGGYIVNGRWNYCSGIPHASHFMATAFLDDGATPPATVLLVVPRGDYRVLPDWGGEQTLGMRASGSNSVEVEDAFVPAHHVVPFHVMFARPDGMEHGTPGTRLHGNPMYLGRLMGPYHASLVACVVGAAWAAIDEYERTSLAMKTYLDPTLLRADALEFQRPLGTALAAADAAEAVLMTAAQRYMDLCARWERDGTPISVEDNLRLWTMLQQAGQLGCGVVEQLFHAVGAFATKRGNRLQRYFRDVQMYRTHMSAQYKEFEGFVGRAHLGRPTGFRGL
jgi:3-hydroxy-9,10-secoandrosta-1,3,5(10)-triene-9,17-dione monooxygenase